MKKLGTRSWPQLVEVERTAKDGTKLVIVLYILLFKFL